MTVRELRKLLRGTNPDAHIALHFPNLPNAVFYYSSNLPKGDVVDSEVSVREENVTHDDGAITPRIIITFDRKRTD